MTSHWMGVGLAVVLLPGIASSQADLWAVESNQQDAFGEGLSGLGDVNGDGVPDAAVGAPLSGKVKVYSGADGALLYTLSRKPESLFGDVIAGLGDVDGDGLGDFAVGAPHASPGIHEQAGRVQVFSGVDGSVLFTDVGELAFAKVGGNVLAAGDLNLDGVPDLAYTHRDETLNRVLVVSGSSFQKVQDLSGFQTFDGFGRSLAGSADIDGDGADDLVIGAPAAWPGATVTAYSGVELDTPFPLLPLYHTTLIGYPGFFMPLDLVGDWDGQGGADVLVLGTTPGYLLDAQGVVSEVSLSGAGTVSSVRSLGDVDGDGVADVAVGRAAVSFSTTLNAAVDVHSGATFDVLYSTHGDGGPRVAPAGDVDGDGRPDLLAAFVQPVGVGAVRVVPGHQGTIRSVGESCTPGTTDPLSIEVFGTPSGGGRLVAVIEAKTTHEPAWLLLGLPTAPFELAWGCTLHVGPTVAMVPLSLGVFEDAVEIDLPTAAGGLSVALQLVQQMPPFQLGGPPGPLGTSNGVIARVVD